MGFFVKIYKVVSNKIVSPKEYIVIFLNNMIIRCSRYFHFTAAFTNYILLKTFNINGGLFVLICMILTLTYRKTFNLQFGSFKASKSACTPESPSLFQPRSSSLRCEGFDFKAEPRAAQPSLVTSQWSNLLRELQSFLSLALKKGVV